VSHEGGASLLEGKYDETASRNSFLDALNEWRSGGKKAVVQEEKKAGNFLEGEFNEHESHESFLNALKAWRNEKKDSTRRGLSPAYNLESSNTTEVTATGTGTEGYESIAPRKTIKFSETNGMSYADKLLLYKLRKDAEEKDILN
jgi:hypothetical protein